MAMCQGAGASRRACAATPRPASCTLYARWLACTASVPPLCRYELDEDGNLALNKARVANNGRAYNGDGARAVGALVAQVVRLYEQRMGYRSKLQTAGQQMQHMQVGHTGLMGHASGGGQGRDLDWAALQWW